RMRLEAAVETVRREFECEPAVAVAAACPELPPATSAAGRVRELERELRLMGPVNPLALEEFTALQERHAFLAGQLDDVKASRRWRSCSPSSAAGPPPSTCSTRSKPPLTTSTSTASSISCTSSATRPNSLW